jgi:hypothetical protein
MVPRRTAFTCSCVLVCCIATILWVSDDCTYLAYDDAKETCLAIRGVITARFAGIDKDTSLEVDEYLQSVIKNAIEADESGIRVMNIRNVIYTSGRIPPNSSNGQVIQSATRTSGESAGGTILLSAILSCRQYFHNASQSKRTGSCDNVGTKFGSPMHFGRPRRGQEP